MKRIAKLFGKEIFCLVVPFQSTWNPKIIFLLKKIKYFSIIKMAKLQKTSIAPFFMLARIRLASESEILHRTSFVCIAATYILWKKMERKNWKLWLLLKPIYSVHCSNRIQFNEHFRNDEIAKLKQNLHYTKIYLWWIGSP